ncbi:bifunctional adenosylcobinamide kinase/adenosylcobinamide-phosphate guanylyltransferase [Paenibacillus sp. NEAU-GSW1]|nr:bifunctional adenosylcobinamide kinase/adenosylcobinamide-phosphate guanylyltransferase [Paenibacillus sp. NEAU-GSW1]MUT67027.1 bifunctional adenosylcobinamide kinase/adenosylcobinamide-phosphate guanylyltransferase [Paenibacillus sp. NEAU-GSW1]
MALLVTGGARSGKSSFAEQLASRLGERGIYIATSQIWDDEMRQRIARHKQDRDSVAFEWRTIEEPLRLAEQLNELSRQLADEGRDVRPPVVLVDCLTLWLTNWLMHSELADEEDAQLPLEQQRLAEEAEKLADAISGYPHPLVLVTNEVGDGIVPEYPLGRVFRDEQGRLNQRIAAVCERVFLVTAGIPIELKSRAFQWDEL